MTKLLISFLALLIFFTPAITAGQILGRTIDDTATLASGASISDTELATLGAILGGAEISWNAADSTDWSLQNLESVDLSTYDKRIILDLLPALTNPNGGGLDGVVVDRLRRGYSTDETHSSKEFDGASNVSQHHYGKAVSLSALGTTSCAAEVIFPQSIEYQKPLWVHHQIEKPAQLSPRWPFGRSFDTVARQFFWLEARAFTGRAITSLSWSNFLQQVAKAEIEDRFGLTPGSLAGVSANDLKTELAEARLAQNLGISQLPDVDSEVDFFTVLGRNQVENELNLPNNSLIGQSWREVYQRVGQRVLEDQLALPEPTLEEASATFNTNNTRFALLKARLENRAQLYRDPRLAFNLPPERYLASEDGLDIFQRILIGDPDAFAVVGGYFLADSLELSPADTKMFIDQLVSAAGRNDIVINLRSARPINSIYEPESLFTPDASTMALVFEKIGRAKESTIQAQLPRLNESVLLAVSGGTTSPTYQSLRNRLTQRSSRNSLVTQLANASQEDANYPNGFTLTSLRTRGIELLAQAAELPAADIESYETDNSQHGAPNVGEVLDNLFGWPTGTAKDMVARQSSQASVAQEALRDRQIVEIGAKALWARLQLPDTLQQELASLYFDGVLPTVDDIPDEFTDEAGEVIDELGNGVDDSDIEVIGEEEAINDQLEEFVNIDPPQVPLGTELNEVLDITLADATYFIDGRMLPALTRSTTTLLGREIAEATQESSDALLSLYDEPDLDRDVQNSLNDIFIPYVSTDYLEGTANAAQSQDTYGLWRNLYDELIYQWNVSCPDKQVEAITVINRVIDYLVSLPNAEENSEDSEIPDRPVQILTFLTDSLSQETTDKIKNAYPGANGDDIKWGVYGNVARAWDHLFIGY